MVTTRRFVTRDEMAKLCYKPDSLPRIAFSGETAYDPLERIIW